jgi:hypothetical protein
LLLGPWPAIGKIFRGWARTIAVKYAAEEIPSMVIVRASATFPPGRASFISKLFAEILTNQRMRIEIPLIVRILSSEKSRSS